MQMSALQLVISVSGPVVQLLILGTMVRRRLRSQFPIFFVYTFFFLIAELVEFWAAGRSEEQYFYIYWSITGVGMFIGFGVLYEVFVNALRPYSALIDLGQLLFKWAAAFLILAALVTAFTTSGSEPNKLVASISLLQRIVRLMECGLLLLLVIFESRLGLSWRNHGMAIALGLGTYASVDLMVSYACSHFTGVDGILGLIDTSVYLGALVFWAVALLLPQPVRKNVLDSPSRLIFQRWNEALMATPLISRKAQPTFAPVESFLPGVEQTVERVMARKMMH